MKKLAVLFFCLIMAFFSFAQETDTLEQSTTSDSGYTYWFIILIILLPILYIILDKLSKRAEANAKKKVNLTEEERNELINFLKDKTLPFFRVKGMTHYDIKKPGGYIVELVPEENNKKDPHAVAVVHSTLGIIGHLPKGNEFVYRKAKEQKIYGAIEIGISRSGYPYGKFWLDPSIFSQEDIAQMVNLEVDDNFRP